MNGFRPHLNLFGEYELPRIKSYRIPYIGSKNAIASQLFGKILTHTNNHGKRRFVDAFCGGGAMTYGALQTQMFKEILGNDLNTELILLHQNLKDLDLQYIAGTPCLILPNKEVQDKYPFVKMIDDIPSEYQYAFRITYSFGNNTIDNLWGDNMIVKYDIAYHLFHQPGKVSGLIASFIGVEQDIHYDYVETSITNRYKEYKNHIGLYRQYLKSNELEKKLRRLQQVQQLEQLEQLQRLQQLEQLEQLQRLQRLQQNYYSEQLLFTSVDYRDINYKMNDVVYFDPPYRGTIQGKGYYTHQFDNDKFEQFARTLKCPVFISEYQPKIKGFQPILKIEKEATLNNKGASKGTRLRYEYLHWNGIR